MRIVTKIGAGYGILIALIFAVLAYQSSLMYQMESINRNMAGINFRAAIASLQLLRDVDQVEEFTRKFFATGGDPGYRARMKETRDAAAQDLQDLRSIRLSPAEKAEIDRLAGHLRRFLEVSAVQLQDPNVAATPDADTALADQLALLSLVRAQAQAVIRVTRKAIEDQVEESAREGQRAERISWAAALASLLVSLLVSFWIVRSISRPLRDLTGATRAVAQGQFLHQLDIQGHDELSQLASDFNTMTRRLGEFDQLKKDFVSHVSHELKGPLSSLRETNRLLLDDIPGPLTDKQRRLLELSLQSCKRLASMIGNLLDLSRIEAGVMEYKIRRDDLTALVRAALDEFEVQLRDKGLRLEADLPSEPLTVQCDGDRIIQVVGNLLGNALKFSPPGSAIRVCLRRLGEIPKNLPGVHRNGSEGFALVSVSDSGPGIPDPEKERIFEKFRQLRNTKSEFKIAGPGVGLGLAIGRTIVEAHGGAIWVEDNPGGGSVFHVLLGAGVPAKAASPVSRPI